MQWNCGWSVRAATKHAAPAGSSTPGHQPAWSMEHASTRMRTRAGMHATRTQPSVSPAAALTRIQHFRVSRPGAPLRLRPHAPESGGGARRPLSLERSHLRSHSAQSVHRGHNATTVDTYTILAEWHSRFRTRSTSRKLGFLSGRSNTIFSTARPFRSAYDDGDGRGGGGGSGEGKGRGLASCAGPKKLQSARGNGGG